MRIIFLDFDGPIIPLASHEAARGLMEKAWPPCIAVLNRITDATGAKIVLSTSWRWPSQKGPQADELLRRWGATGEIIGSTPILESAWKPENKLWIGVPRGREIQAWLDEHTDVDSFVIIDDDGDMEHLCSRLIQTPFEIGLTEADADRAIEMLTGAQKRPALD
jgi:hypothetical protein